MSNQELSSHSGGRRWRAAGVMGFAGMASGASSATRARLNPEHERDDEREKGDVPYKEQTTTI